VLALRGAESLCEVTDYAVCLEVAEMHDEIKRTVNFLEGHFHIVRNASLLSTSMCSDIEASKVLLECITEHLQTPPMQMCKDTNERVAMRRHPTRRAAEET